jgi:serine/threonine protein kinase
VALVARLSDGRLCALKWPTRAFSRFAREVETLRALSHDHIVQFIDEFEEVDPEGGDRRPYLVMEYLCGNSLHAHIRAHRKQETAVYPQTAIGWFVDIARALAYCHERGIVHRDLKPGNLFVTDDGAAKILDFGIARDERGTETVGGVPGTYEYMAPEIAAPKQFGITAAGFRGDAASDIFSVGVCLYHAITSHSPFSERISGKDATDQYLAFRRRAEALLTQPAEWFANVDQLPAELPQLKELFLRALAPLPAQRYASMTDLLRGLKACERQLGRDDITETNLPDNAGEETAFILSRPEALEMMTGAPVSGVEERDYETAETVVGAADVAAAAPEREADSLTATTLTRSEGPEPSAERSTRGGGAGLLMKAVVAALVLALLWSNRGPIQATVYRQLDQLWEDDLRARIAEVEAAADHSALRDAAAGWGADAEAMPERRRKMYEEMSRQLHQAALTRAEELTAETMTADQFDAARAALAGADTRYVAATKRQELAQRIAEARAAALAGDLATAVTADPEHNLASLPPYAALRELNALAQAGSLDDIPLPSHGRIQDVVKAAIRGTVSEQCGDTIEAASLLALPTTADAERALARMMVARRNVMRAAEDDLLPGTLGSEHMGALMRAADQLLRNWGTDRALSQRLDALCSEAPEDWGAWAAAVRSEVQSLNALTQAEAWPPHWVTRFGLLLPKALPQRRAAEAVLQDALSRSGCIHQQYLDALAAAQRGLRNGEFDDLLLPNQLNAAWAGLSSLADEWLTAAQQDYLKTLREQGQAALRAFEDARRNHHWANMKGADALGPLIAAADDEALATRLAQLRTATRQEAVCRRAWRDTLGALVTWDLKLAGENMAAFSALHPESGPGRQLQAIVKLAVSLETTAVPEHHEALDALQSLAGRWRAPPEDSDLDAVHDYAVTCAAVAADLRAFNKDQDVLKLYAAVWQVYPPARAWLTRESAAALKTLIAALDAGRWPVAYRALNTVPPGVLAEHPDLRTAAVNAMGARIESALKSTDTPARRAARLAEVKSLLAADSPLGERKHRELVAALTAASEVMLVEAPAYNRADWQLTLAEADMAPGEQKRVRAPAEGGALAVRWQRAGTTFSRRAAVPFVAGGGTVLPPPTAPPLVDVQWTTQMATEPAVEYATGAGTSWRAFDGPAQLEAGQQLRIRYSLPGYEQGTVTATIATAAEQKVTLPPLPPLPRPVQPQWPDTVPAALADSIPTLQVRAATATSWRPLNWAEPATALAPGRYRVRVALDGYLSAEQTFDVAAGVGPAALPLPLPQPLFNIHFRWADWVPAQYRVAAGTLTVDSRPDARGELTRTPGATGLRLPAGSHAILIEPPDTYRSWWQNLAASDDATSHILVLEPPAPPATVVADVRAAANRRVREILANLDIVFLPSSKQPGASHRYRAPKPNAAWPDDLPAPWAAKALDKALRDWLNIWGKDADNINAVVAGLRQLARELPKPTYDEPVPPVYQIYADPAAVEAGARLDRLHEATRYALTLLQWDGVALPPLRPDDDPIYCRFAVHARFPLSGATSRSRYSRYLGYLVRFQKAYPHWPARTDERLINWLEKRGARLAD